MSENIDELIKTLNSLKLEKQKMEEEHSENINNFIKEKENLEESQNKIRNYLNLIKDEMNKCEVTKKEFFTNFNNNQKEKQNDIEKSEKSIIQIKKFQFRESLLTNLMTKDSYETIYNIFLSLLICLVGIFILSEYIENQKFFNILVFTRSIQGIETYMTQWITKLIFSISFIIYIHILKDLGNKRIANIIFNISLIIIIFSFRFTLNTEKFSLLFKFVHYTDNLILILKLYSYYMEKVNKMSYKLKERNGSENETKNEINDSEITGMSIIIKDNGHSVEFSITKINLFKEIKNFVYFYLAPTLVYRDVYPKNNSINFTKMIKLFVNIILAFVFFILVFETEINPMFIENENKKRSTFIQTLVGFIIFSLMLFFMLFYGITHCLLNFYAELTRFADRRFYKSFYSAKNPIKFYKSLNLYFEDFLESYVRTQLNYYTYEIIRIIFYCFVAEYIFLNATNLDIPFITFILIISHCIAIPISYVKGEKKILFNWMITSLGMGLIVMLNYIEFYISEDRISSGIDYNYGFWRIPKVFAFYDYKFY